jgi:hypothetical protein
MTAIEVTASRHSTPNAPVVPSQKNSRTIGSQPASAYTTMTASPKADWLSEATRGAPVRGSVRASAPGRTRSRPRANMYRATALWKLIMAANRLVMNSTVAISATVELDIANSMPGPCWAATAATLSSP